MTYEGFPLKYDGSSNAYKTATWQECLQKCRALPECRYFNYRANVHDCRVKTGMGEKVEYPDYVGAYFGHRDVEGCESPS